MGAPAEVTIRRQVLEVELIGSEAAGRTLRQRLPAVCSEVLAPAIEAALGAVDPGEGYLHLDRLELDLALDLSLVPGPRGGGPLDGAAFDGAAFDGAAFDGFGTLLATAVRRGIAEHFRAHPAPQAARSGSDLRGIDAAGGLARTAAQTVDDALITFLRSGRLPWSFRLPAGRTLEDLVLATWSEAGGRREPPPPTVRRLRAVLGDAAPRERVVMQFTPAFTMAVLASLSPDLADRVQRVEAPVGGDPAAPAPRAPARQVRLAALAAAAAGRLPSLSDLAGSPRPAVDPSAGADRTLEAPVERDQTGRTATALPASPQSASESAATGPDTGPAAPGSAPSRPVPPSADGPDGRGVLVDCAGLVLLHPFLPRFLTGLGVAVDERIVDADRALCLLHHLATGELTAPEHRLTLAKVLCGVPLERPVEADVGLSEAETAEATALLEAAIGHWEALRSTSPDGLRVEFLSRPGILSATAGGDWLLRVETRTVDILLDQLPWGISPVRLPWMRDLMMVEWR